MVGLSASAASTAGRPRGSPIAPRAATAASRQRASSWPPAIGGEVGHRRPVAPLGHEPGRSDDDEGVGVAERAGHRGGERRTRAPSAHPRCSLDRPASQGHRTGGQRPLDVAGRELAEAGQRAEGGHLDLGVGITEPPPGQGRVPPVTRHDEAPPSQVGAAVAARIRGNIVAHPVSMYPPDATPGDAAGVPPPPDDPLVEDLPIDGGVVPLAKDPGRRRRIWPSIVGVVVALVVLAAFIAAHVSVNYYVITPGDASPVAQYIDVPPADNHPLTGRILLTDVFVTPLNALNYLQYRFFDSDSEVVSAPDLLGPTPDENQFLAQGYLQMAQAKSFATAAALTRLGYKVSATNAGALVYGIAPGSPAARTLKVAQVITAVNATPTPTYCALIDALHGLSPGTSVSLAVEQSSINDVGDVVPGPTVRKTVTLGTPPRSVVDTGCGPPTTPTAYLGIVPQTQQDWHFPVNVTVHTQDIGGPSAGLAMTLGIIDKLSTGRLTGHRIVAATGTIDQYGNVGDVGGVAEKTIAVERAGATVFFVPSVELHTAESKASPQLHVYAVNNVTQALRILERLGGRVPTKPVSAQAAP